MGYDYEIAVVGGGPGGYVAAIRAAQAGKRVCLIESGSLGGVCLNEGCIPTKTLIRSASLLQEVRGAADYGITGVEAERVGVSMPALQQRKSAVVRQLVGGVAGLLRGNGVTVLPGRASFLDAHTLAVGDTSVSAQWVIVATGSRAVIPPFIALEGSNTLLTSRELLELDHLPASAAVIGGGVIGVEFAYLLALLGVSVTVLELLDHILPMVDEEISGMARQRLERDGVTFHLGARVERVRDNTVFFTKDGAAQSVGAELVVMAVGRAPCTEGLAAEKAGLVLEKGAIPTDEGLRTNVPNIYAVGDVNGRVMLAHTASHEGMVAVENLLGGNARMHYERIPACVYLSPELAGIGLTEAQARERHGGVRVGRFPMAANGKSLVEGDASGMVKVIVEERYGELLGAHIYGHHATEMIGELAVAMGLEATADEITGAVHPHPTVSEALPEAFLAAYGRAIHFL